MPDQSVENASRPSLLDVSEWPLRRKLALALAIPMLVAAVFGGLRFADESASAANYSQSASQVTILEPAIDFLNAAEDTAVTTRDTTLSPRSATPPSSRSTTPARPSRTPAPTPT